MTNIQFASNTPLVQVSLAYQQPMTAEEVAEFEELALAWIASVRREAARHASSQYSSEEK